MWRGVRGISGETKSEETEEWTVPEAFSRGAIKNEEKDHLRNGRTGKITLHVRNTGICGRKRTEF